MRAVPALVLLLLAGCAGTPPANPPPPDVPVALRWPAGTRFRAELAAGVPDEPRWRAALCWWREALRQTVKFELADAPERGLPVLELTIDPDGKALAACLCADGRERALAGASFAAVDLAAAIDRLAWSCRLALGEAAAAPLPIAAGTSADPAVVLAIEDAQALLRDGGIEPAARILRDARRRDGGSTVVLDGLATLALLQGDAATTERIAREALGYETRLLPTTQHRLARTLLLARAARPGAAAADVDRELLRLGEVARRERPHDPQPEFTCALALNFLGEFAAARARLEPLQPRLRDHAIVDYHLGWACLGGGDAAGAVPWFERAAARLPVAWLLLPRAIALHDAGRHEQLRELLAALCADDGAAGLRYDVLRLQAAHALLGGDDDGARALLVDLLRWLLQHPLLLQQRAGEFAETAAVLVRLGGHEELPSLIAAIHQQHPGTTVADACTYAGGLVEVAARGDRLAAVEATLARSGDSPWAALLAAFAHERRGEIADLQQELGRAARLAGTPLTKALLAKSLAAAGRADDAARLRAALRAEMRTLHLRRPCRHPLLGPELAYAWR